MFFDGTKCGRSDFKSQCCGHNSRSSLYLGLNIYINGQSIPKTNRERISVYDFDIVDSQTDIRSALKCQSELSASLVHYYTYGCLESDGDTPVNWNINNLIDAYGDARQGWSGTRAVEYDRRVHYVTSREQTPVEGYFNCHMIGDNNTVYPLPQ